MGQKRKDLGVRVVSALLLLPLVVAVILWGGVPFRALVAVAAALVASEMYGIVGLRLRHPAAIAGLLGAALLAWLVGDLPATAPAVVVLLAAAPVVAFSTCTLVPPGGELSKAALSAAWVVVSISYAGLLGTLGALRALPEGLAYTLLALAMTWGNDTGAYFAGLFFGRHKLYPKVSPNKTWEGFFGGLATSILACIVFRFFLPLGWIDVLVLGGVAGVLGPMGDLSESLIKRAFGVKDSGKLIPGHGGLFDRIDALLFVAPWTLAYVRLFLG